MFILIMVLILWGTFTLITVLRTRFGAGTVKLTGKVVSCRLKKTNVFRGGNTVIKGARIHYYPVFEYLDEDGSLNKYVSGESCFGKWNGSRHMSFYKTGHGKYIYSRYELRCMLCRSLILLILALLLYLIGKF